MAAGNTFTGARALFKVDGVPIGFAGGVSGSESIDYEPVDVLNVLQVREFVPVAYRATLNAQVFRVIGQSVKQLGIFSRLDNILTDAVLTCSVEDRVTRETIAQFFDCQASEHSFDISARGLVSENITFVTTKLEDEFENPIGG